ncbi:hypothetical protein [Viridibacillus arvi]|uniref:hypothetical protein n=1 Tax=Viridibacillus arvi TaxID=263475 RepID=UPI0034CEC2F5
MFLWGNIVIDLIFMIGLYVLFNYIAKKYGTLRSHRETDSSHTRNKTGEKE